MLRQIDARSANPAQKGRLFEQLTKAFLQQEKANRARFKQVWLWNDWPNRGQQTDIGIDLVAETCDGQLIAVQCKFISPQGRIAYDQVTHFLTALNSKQWNFAHGIFVSTCDHWTKDAENALNHSKIPVSRWSCEIFEQSSIDWDKVFHRFESKEKPPSQDQETASLKEELAEYKTTPQLPQRPVKTLRNYQKTALAAVLKGFETADRGKLIMACGSGKTLVALRIAESLAPNGAILFLTPSISLLAQSLMDWDADAQSPLSIFAVCSDASADQRQNDPLHMPLLEIKIPPTTDPQKLAAAFRKTKQPNAKGLTVIFCTYQSLDVIHQAQQHQQNPLPPLDLIICDEAHRTTGQSDPNAKADRGFQRVHDPAFIRAGKRLYMTATPRIYGDRAQRKAAAKQILLASMDDEKLFGQNFHQLGFGKAIDEEILCDYQVIIQEVDLEQASRYLDAELRAEESEINLDNGARMIGCWNALRKHGKPGVFAENEPPARRAVAFSNRIAQSKLFDQYFQTVIQACQEHETDAGQSLPSDSSDSSDQLLQCQTKHVDGTQLSRHRADALQWLREPPADGQCKILTNARCLTEGIDVPALDAVLFLQPRESEIDVVQAVGRVMRRANNKQRGYIIIPIAVPKGISGRKALEKGVYKTVWQVLNAVKAHDDRFAAKINQLALAQKGYLQQKDIGQESQQSHEIADALQDQLEFSSLNPALKNFVLAKIVHDLSEPDYWTKWIDTTQSVVQRTQARLSDLSQRAETKPIFDRFFHALKNNVRGMPIKDEDAIEMLALHQVSRPVFDALFGQQSSPLANALESVLDELQKYGLAKELDGMQTFFREVKIRAQGVKDSETRQKILIHFYESFFRRTIPRQVQSLGIAYSPLEAVDYILHAVQDILKRHWPNQPDGKPTTLGSPGVNIIEPFAGTGTFLARLIADQSLIADDELDFKYQNEIFGHEILPLAYSAAQANIASAYEERTGRQLPFPNLWLGDTFLAYETANQPQPAFDFPGFERNAAILELQKQAPIRVIIGNPPWSSKKIRFSFDKSIEAAESDFVMELIGAQKTKRMALGLVGMAIFWTATTAQAQLVIDVYPSQDDPTKTLWIFSGSSTAHYGSSIRSSQNYHARDSWKYSGGDGTLYFANNPTNQLFNLAPLFSSTNTIDIESVTARLPGVPRHVLSPEPIQFSNSATNAPTITISNTSRTIGRIFMNDADDDEIGIRITPPNLIYSANDSSSWFGSGILNKPISDFFPSGYRGTVALSQPNAPGAPYFSRDGGSTLQLRFYSRVIPEPAGVCARVWNFCVGFCDFPPLFSKERIEAWTMKRIPENRYGQSTQDRKSGFTEFLGYLAFMCF